MSMHIHWELYYKYLDTYDITVTRIVSRDSMCETVVSTRGEKIRRSKAVDVLFGLN